MMWLDRQERRSPSGSAQRGSRHYPPVTTRNRDSRHRAVVDAATAHVTVTADLDSVGTANEIAALIKRCCRHRDRGRNGPESVRQGRFTGGGTIGPNAAWEHVSAEAACEIMHNALPRKRLVRGYRCHKDPSRPAVPE